MHWLRGKRALIHVSNCCNLRAATNEIYLRGKSIVEMNSIHLVAKRFEWVTRMHLLESNPRYTSSDYSDFFKWNSTEIELLIFKLFMIGASHVSSALFNFNFTFVPTVCNLQLTFSQYFFLTTWHTIFRPQTKNRTMNHVSVFQTTAATITAFWTRRWWRRLKLLKRYVW